MTFEEWKKILDDMITAFKLLIIQNDRDDILFKEDYLLYSKRKQRKIAKGLRYFAKYFQHLWY